MIATAIMGRLFQDPTPISGSSSAEEGCTGTLCLPGTTLNPFSLGKGDAGWISSCSFVVDMERCSPAQLLFDYLKYLGPKIKLFDACVRQNYFFFLVSYVD